MTIMTHSLGRLMATVPGQATFAHIRRPGGSDALDWCRTFEFYDESGCVIGEIMTQTLDELIDVRGQMEQQWLPYTDATSGQPTPWELARLPAHYQIDIGPVAEDRALIRGIGRDGQVLHEFPSSSARLEVFRVELDKAERVYGDAGRPTLTPEALVEHFSSAAFKPCPENPLMVLIVPVADGDFVEEHAIRVNPWRACLYQDALDRARRYYESEVPVPVGDGSTAYYSMMEVAGHIREADKARLHWSEAWPGYVELRFTGDGDLEPMLLREARADAILTVLDEEGNLGDCRPFEKAPLRR
jgi:hypothetical protein